MNNLSKRSSLALVLLTYLVAFAVCFFCYDLILSWTGSVILAFFVLDVIATLIVWGVGLICGNASMYDPYWSVVPIIMVVFFSAAAPALLTPLSILYIVVIAVWGIRLTVNWIVDWPGLSHQDWRYTMLKQRNPKMYFLTNLFGINLVPTFFVFAAMVPAFIAINNASAVNALTIAGAAVCVGAAVLQLVSDGQMRRFRRAGSKGKNIQSGLWKYSRHPNYFGEVSFWWGIYIIQVSVLPQLWYLIIGPVLMTLLFVFISVPMMKNKLLKSKEGYEEYVKTTSMLVPLPSRKK